MAELHASAASRLTRRVPTLLDLAAGLGSTEGHALGASLSPSVGDDAGAGRFGPTVGDDGQPPAVLGPSVGDDNNNATSRLGPSVGDDTQPLSPLGSTVGDGGGAAFVALGPSVGDDIDQLRSLGPSVGDDTVQIGSAADATEGRALGPSVGDDEAEVSDRRRKTDIRRVGSTVFGLPLYDFRYVGGEETYRGVMAQDVLAVMPDAVTTGGDGFMRVRYGMLGTAMQRIA